MKRLFYVLVFVLCPLWSFAQYSGSGSGTESDPYLIFNETQLSQMGNFLNQSDVVFRLMKDLDLTSWIAENSPSQGWQPIGVESSPFKGKLIGNNKTIRGLVINRVSTSYVGFFGYLSEATISDLTIECTTIKGANYTGSFAGYSLSSTLSNVTVNGTSVTGSDYTGGLIGLVKGGTLTNMNATLTDEVSGEMRTGGLIGESNNNCAVTTYNVQANVNGTTDVGGVVGTLSSSTYSNGAQTGDVTASTQAGGFAGNGTAYTLSTFTAKGNVLSISATAGGITAYNSGTNTLTNCSHDGKVQATSNVGGIIGLLYSGSTTFTSCTSKGKLTNTGNYTGGIVGCSNGAFIAAMQSCSHFGDIKGTAYVGGLIGAVLDDVASSPTLSTYTVRSSSSNTGGTLLQTTQETLNSSTTMRTVNINNCTAIGNIEGNNYVGGLVGMEGACYSFTSTQNSTSCTNNNYDKYLFKDGVFANKSVTYKYSLSYTYNTYACYGFCLSLTNNYYSGNIKGAQYVGGLVGQKKGGTLEKNYSYANIYGTSAVGGIVGDIVEVVPVTGVQAVHNTLKANVANCSVISATGSNIGRIYGSNSDSGSIIGAMGSSEGNRALTTCQVSLAGVTQEIADDFQQGTSIGPSLLRLKATYVAWGWNFNNDWDILETECYPYKRYQAAPPVIESNLVSQANSISGMSVDGGTVYLFYKNREAVSTECNGNAWSFSTDPLQSGATVQVYADVEGKTPSYLTTANVGFPGSGTEEDPYRVYTAEDLQGASRAGYYKLMNDIDLTSWIDENSPTKGWLPIGHNGTEPTYIDGDSHKVTGLWTNTAENFTGLFSNYPAGQIKNLNVEIATSKKVKGGSNTGGLIGRFANGKILNCSVKGDVEGTSDVGGVVGSAPSTILTSLTYNGVAKATSASAFVGGIVGNASGAISACNVDATVTATGSAYVSNLISDIREMIKAGGIEPGQDVTILLDNADFSEGNGGSGLTGTAIPGWEIEGSLTEHRIRTGNIETWHSNFNIHQTITDMPAGVYDITVQGFVRHDGTETNQTIFYAGDSQTALMQCSDQWSEEMIFDSSKESMGDNNYDVTNANGYQCNGMTGAYYWFQTPNPNGADMNYKGWKEGDNYYTNHIKVFLKQAGDLTIGIKCDAGSGSPTDWIIWDNFQITYIGKNMEASEQLLEGPTVGGIAGQAGGTITNCNAIATVTTTQGGKVGGLAGVTNDLVTKCMSTSTINVSGGTNSRVGGLVGYATADITLCLANGSVSATGDNAYTGGLVGYSYKDSGTVNIANCYSTATVSGTEYSGGLVGYAFNTHIDKCYAKGNISGVMYGGGVVGELEQACATLTNSVALSNILSLSAQSSWGSRVIGGYKNGAVDPDESNYALSTMQVSLNDVPQRKTDDLVEGIAKSADELMLSATYMGLGWDFEHVWGIDEGEIYPYLLWEIDINPVTEISFDKSSLLVAVGKTETLTATVLPMGATNKRLTWTSDNTAVATVENGTVTAVAVGTANITATATDGSGVSATCRVTVTANKDAAIAELQAKVDEAQALYDNSTEGDEIGQYAAGARATLLVAIRNVRSQISSTMEEATITQCMADMEAAIETFQSKKVTAGEDTDISALDNVVYINNVEAAAGQQITLSVKMKNTEGIQTVQFDLHLPDGVTVATDEDDFELIELSTERTTARKMDSFSSSQLANGAYRVLINSNRGYTFDGEDGEIAIVTVNLSGDMQEGDYPIILKDIVMVNTNSEGFETSYVKSTLSISAYTPGDVNADSKVNAIDLNAIVNYILERRTFPFTFVEKAADLNNDSKINAVDVNTVTNMILRGTAPQNVKVRGVAAPIFVGSIEEW